MNGLDTITVVICNTSPHILMGETWEDRVTAKENIWLMNSHTEQPHQKETVKENEMRAAKKKRKYFENLRIQSGKKRVIRGTFR